jgi:tetratricopeptide (TPR) repeat protein
VTLALSIIVFFVQAKFRVMLLPFLMIFAGCGILEFWETFRKRKFLRLGFLSLIFCLFFILLSPMQGGKSLAKETQMNVAEFRYHYSKAMAYEKDMDYQSALNELVLADRIQPDNPNIIYSSAVIWYDLNKLDKAEEQFKRVIEISPFYVDAYYNLGFLYNQKRKFDEAITLLEKAAFLDPDDIGVSFELAKAYRAKGMLKKAKQELEPLLKKTKYRPADKAMVEKALGEIER